MLYLVCFFVYVHIRFFSGILEFWTPSIENFWNSLFFFWNSGIPYQESLFSRYQLKILQKDCYINYFPSLSGGCFVKFVRLTAGFLSLSNSFNTFSTSV